MLHGVKISQAARAHWQFVVASCLVLVAISAGFAYTKTPTYSAQARLLVGSYDTRITAIPGNAVATSSLATTYSRLAGTGEVAQRAADIAGVPKSQIAGHISASPLVSSPIVVVTAAGDNQLQALQFANAGASALTNYVQGLNPNTPDQILQRYQQANNDLTRAQNELSTLEARTRGNPSDANAAAESAKRAEVSTKQLQVESLRSSYTNATVVSSFGLQSIQAAVAMGSDRRSTVQLYGFAGLVVGLLVSLALSLLREERKVKRRENIIDTTNNVDISLTSTKV